MSQAPRKVKWLPIVSNPDVLNEEMLKLNPVATPFAFCDVWGTDPDLFAHIKEPCLAVTLLFPLTDTYAKAKAAEEERITRDGQVVSPDVFFMRQTVGNACGTIALLHSILNNVDSIPLEPTGPLHAFKQKVSNMTPLERAAALGEDEIIAASHAEAAKTGTEEPIDIHARVDTHFIAFVCVDGHLYELDGRKPWPVNHGPTSPQTLLRDAAQVIRRNFMDLDPRELRFNIMALAPQE